MNAGKMTGYPQLSQIYSIPSDQRLHSMLVHCDPIHQQQLATGTNQYPNRRNALLAFVAGLMGTAAVVMGAYEAHDFPKDAPLYRKQVFETANKYHFYHTLALALIPIARRPFITCFLLLLGVCLFSGSNYYYAITGDETYIMLTPTGGIVLIVGWLSLMLPL